MVEELKTSLLGLMPHCHHYLPVNMFFLWYLSSTNKQFAKAQHGKKTFSESTTVQV